MKMPSALAAVVDRFRQAPDDIAVRERMVAAVWSLSDTVQWQRAWIERLEYVLQEHGITVKPSCFKCLSKNVAVEERRRQRRHTCLDCGYQWRLGMRDI